MSFLCNHSVRVKVTGALGTEMADQDLAALPAPHTPYTHTHTQKSPTFGLMLCVHCLNIVNNFIFEFVFGKLSSMRQQSTCGGL